jgi:hypothetical protein
LIFLNINSKDPTQVSVGAIIDGETTDIGTLNIGISVVGKPEQRLATVSWAVGKHDQNLVYVGGPAKCEVVSDFLRQFAVSEGNGSVNVDVHQRREEFAAFLREHIHPQYLLADTVLAGVGFHYGNMPSTVRKTLEEYFLPRVIYHTWHAQRLCSRVSICPRKICSFWIPPREVNSKTGKSKQFQRLTSGTWQGEPGAWVRTSKETSFSSITPDGGRTHSLVLVNRSWPQRWRRLLSPVALTFFSSSGIRITHLAENLLSRTLSLNSLIMPGGEN